MATYGTTVAIDPIALQKTAKDIDTQRSLIQNCLESIKQDAGALKHVWEGEAANAYESAISKLNEGSPKIVSILQEYVLDLNEIASNFLSDEQKRKAKDEALPGDIFGV